jgi:hypothetical protein
MLEGLASLPRKTVGEIMSSKWLLFAIFTVGFCANAPHISRKGIYYFLFISPVHSADKSTGHNAVD